jgi:DNA-binding FrmR family transcriptional regulator
VSHTTREKAKLINRVRRIRGQMEAIERALEEEKGCADVLQLIAGVRGAINGLMAEVVEDHILLHVADHTLAKDQRNEGAAELIDVVRAYLK